MKHVVLSIVLCLLAVSTSVAQAIPNGGFETWVGDSVLTGWFTSNIPGFIKNIVRSSTPRNGSFAVQGTVIRFGTSPFTAILQSGVNGLGVPISSRADALRGWYRFTSDSSDGVNIITSFRRAGTGTGVGALSITGSQATYREFVVNTLYISSDIPDTAIINITIVGTAAGGNRTHIGTTFTIDDLVWGAASDVDEIKGVLPSAFSLEQNFPNPFNPSTKIQFQIPEAQHVVLTVYDVLGREVAKLVDERLAAGRFRAEFDASDLPSGTYLYRLQTGGFSAVRKMIVVK